MFSHASESHSSIWQMWMLSACKTMVYASAYTSTTCEEEAISVFPMVTQSAAICRERVNLCCLGPKPMQFYLFKNTEKPSRHERWLLNYCTTLTITITATTTSYNQWRLGACLQRRRRNSSEILVKRWANEKTIWTVEFRIYSVPKFKYTIYEHTEKRQHRIHSRCRLSHDRLSPNSQETVCSLCAHMYLCYFGREHGNRCEWVWRLNDIVLSL